MFGMGFMEILLIVIVAIIALGPEKLPTAMVDIAKFFKKVKSGLEEAKSTIDQELNIADMKKEADQLRSSFDDMRDMAKIDLDDPRKVTRIETNPQYQPQENSLETNVQKMQPIVQTTPTNESKRETITFDKDKA
ncbi:MAG: Sec-independent protein translocase subunit TatB [Campylobacterales bacterium]|nr:Sec-independent protein translocase subunit TatB [Campylobacterales bacterium]